MLSSRAVIPCIIAAYSVRQKKTDDGRTGGLVEKHEIPWPVAADVDEQTFNAYQAETPSYYLIDRTGVLRAAGLYYRDLDRAVARFLNEVPSPL